jgi:hypothetical protein
MKKLIPLCLVFALSLLLVSAHGEETFAEAEELIKAKVACDQLTKHQLEVIGDYYMEQMHPGESHEIMDERMGGEGSEALKAMHIRMGQSFYCGDHDALPQSTMIMMMGKIPGQQLYQNTGMMNGFGMMGGTGLFVMSFFGWIIPILTIVALTLLILWLLKQLQQSNRAGKK